MTNRKCGRYSGLLPMNYDWSDLGEKIFEYFPMGYTNLWHVEKRYGAHPDLSGGAQFKRDNRYSPKVYYPKAMEKWGISTESDPLCFHSMIDIS